MPKNIGNEDRAKVKLRVIDFELEGGNAAVENSIRQLTNALTTRNGALGRVVAPKPQKELAAGGNPAETSDTKETLQETEPADVETSTEVTSEQKPKKAKSVFKPKVPTYLPGLDMIGNGTTFKEFALSKKPKSNAQRHLVAAFWLKEHGNSPTINLDKVFTCYRTADWPTTQLDWDATFRGQLTNNRFRRVGPLEYAINPIGEDDVRTMNGTS